MATVFFKVNDIQEQEISSFMKEEGYTTKAEFFRFLVKFFKYNRHSSSTRLHNSIDELENTITTLNKKGVFENLPSLNHQLADA